MDVTALIAWTLLHFLWQGTLVVAGTALALHLLRSASAANRYNLGVAALAVMAAFPLATVVQLRERAVARTASLVAPRTNAAEPAFQSPNIAPAAPREGNRLEVASQGVVSGSAVAPVTERLRRLGDFAAPYLVRAWLLGVLLLSLRLFVGWLGVRRFTRVGVQAPAELVRARFEEMSSRVRGSRSVRLIESALVATPAAIGFLRPVLLWPVSLHSGLTVSQIDLLLAHELAHLKRHDYLVNLLQTLVETALFYHPGVWWLSKRIRHERELCCDDAALEVASDPREYAETLLTLETWRQNAPALAAAATGGDLLARIQRLVGAEAGDSGRRPRWAAFPLASAAIMGALGLAPEAPARMAAAEETGLAPRMHATAKAPTGPAKPSRVFRFSGPGDLETRIRWTEEQAASKGIARYWIGYSVPAEPAGPLVYIDRVIPISLGNGTVLSGHLKFKDADSLKAPGVSLDSVVGPGDLSRTVAFIGINGAAPGAVERVHAASAGLPAHFDGRPLFWLDQAENAESLAWIRQALRQAVSEDLLRDLVAFAGTHTDHRLVFETLKGWVESDAGDSIRASAIEELGAIPLKDAVVFLERVARNDQSRKVRIEAAEALGEHLDPLATTALGSLARTARDPEVAREAAESLGEQGLPEALDELVSLIWSDVSLDVRREAVESLGEIGTPRGVQEVARVAKTHSVKTLRDEAIETLEDVDDRQAVDVLKDLAALDQEAVVRRRSIEALFEKGQLTDGFGAVERLMNSNDDRSAETAVELLGNLESEIAIERLGEIARLDARPQIQRHSAEALGGAAPTETALKVLTALVEQHPRDEVQRQAVESIGKFEGAEIATILVRIARTHSSDRVRVTAIEALDHERHGDVRALLDALARDLPAGQARKAAAEMLFQQPQVTDWLAGNFVKDTVQVQLARLRGMQEMDRSAIPWVIAILRKANDADVRKKALAILAESRDPRARQELARILEH